MEPKEKEIEASEENNADDDFDFDWDDIPEYDLNFAKEIYNVFNEFIDKEDLTETFKSKKVLEKHFQKHCLGDTDKKSRKTNIFYDFTKVNDYKEYDEKLQQNRLNTNTLTLGTLGYKEVVAKTFRKFFEGDKYLILDTLCGFHSGNKSVSIILHSFANKVTTNYNQNTVDFNVVADFKTKTLYPVDANYLETKLNNIIAKYMEGTPMITINNPKEKTEEKELLTESKEDKSELISNFIEDLYDLRKDSIATEGEYGIGNLVFKEFRNLGYLDNLKDLKNEERSKELSLENLKEDIDDDMNTSNDYEYGLADSLPEMTPYMLRQDGALLKCGDIHPYIKMSTKTSYETNLHTLDLHPEFLDWFYENTLDPVTKDLIDKFRKEPTPELMDVLNDLTNEDFCRVRTSNYKVKIGGKNGQIYFRISSTNFDWFNLIWGIVAKFVHDIDNVTVMKDSQTFGGKEFDYYYDHVPVDEFLTLKGNPEIK